jgi:hypothetical protein
LGELGAARLHARLLWRTLHTACAAGIAPVELWCAPDTRHPVFARAAARFGLILRRQRGTDLGERMRAAFATALKQARCAVLIGTDCPALRAQHLRAALDALETGWDAVLTPAEDGGYVLVGLSRPAPSLFRDMPWGSAQVLPRTCERLAATGLRWRLLETLWDVDRPEDLERLRRS